MARTDGIVRALTPGETALAAAVFGAALDPAPVRVRCAKWFMWQPAWVTMAPDGDIWFHPNSGLWRDDFADQPLWLRALFIHELTHVWQVQAGRNLILERRPFARYAYALAPGKAFADYGIEQQATIVETAYRRGLSGPEADLLPFAAPRLT